MDVTTAQEDQADQREYNALLERATALGRTLFTFDDDLLCEAHRRQKEDMAFAGVIYQHLLQVAIGACIDDLELIARTMDTEDVHNQVYFLLLCVPG